MLALLPGIALALLALAPGSASAQPLACGQTITRDTTLHADLGPCPATGLVIGADNVTLDLNGHALIGNDTDASGGDTGVRNDAGHDGTVVENGTIRRFDTSIRFDGADHSRVSDVTINPGCCDNPVVEVLDSNGSQIEENDFAAPEGSHFEGQVFEVSGSHNVIKNNIASGPEPGFEAAFHVSGSHSTVSGNASLDNGGIVIDGSLNRVTQNRVDGGNFGGLGVVGARNLVARNFVAHTGGGMDVFGSGNVILKNRLDVRLESEDLSLTVGGSPCRNIRIEENTLHSGMGVECQDARIERNAMFEAGMALAVSHTLIRQNTISGAVAAGQIGYGIWLHGGSDNSIENNTISDADYSGVFVGPAYGGSGHSVGTNVEGNLVTRSGFDPYAGDNDDGIHVDDPGTVIADNRANHNADYGIQAVPGVIDGGGNTASGNGNPLQCLNVVCN